MAECYNCGTSLELSKVYRTTLCPDCGKEVKACKNCKFYSPGAHWDCHETISEAVRDKERANFCDYFVISGGKSLGGVSRSKEEDAKKKFDGLFGG